MRKNFVQVQRSVDDRTKKLDAQAAGGALVVVDIEDESAEGGRAAAFDRLFCDECGLIVGS